VCPLLNVREGDAVRDSGFIKVERDIRNWRWYCDSNTFRVFFHLLLCANFTDCEFEEYLIKRGQLVTGRKKLASELNITERQVRTALGHLKATNEIAIEPHTKYSIITIKNYDKYQSATSRMSGKRPASDQQTTNDRPTSDQRPTTNKKNKNVKNEKNVINTYSDNPELNEAILEFVKFRKGIKKPMTDNAVKLMIGKLNKLTSITSEQIEIINQSIVNGWTGLYPLKEQKRKEPIPSWMPKNQNNYDFDAIEKKLLGINNDPAFVAEREALQKELQEKYGK
jgi:hypothetical protein